MPLPSQRLLTLCLPVVLLIIFALPFLHSGSISAPIKQFNDSFRAAPSATPAPKKEQCPEVPKFHNLAFSEKIAALYSTIKLPVTAERYTDVRGKTFSNGGNKHWQHSLGKDVVVVDIDTRIPKGKNEIFNPNRMNWETVESQGGGLLSTSFVNHYLYSQIHGYDYKFFHARPLKDHYATWIKPHILYEMLTRYKWVVFIDADAVVQHLEVPMEFLFNRWNITPNTSIAMPIDTRQDLNGNLNASMDARGKVVLNTGVVVAQNLPNTMEMLDAWRTCTDERRYPGCGKWKANWSHEQRAFSEYIRYDFNKDGNNIVEIPCDEANGFPGLKGQVGVYDDCRGQFMRHHTLVKAEAKVDVGNVVMQSMSEIIQKSFLKNQELYVIEEMEQTEQGDGLETAPDGVPEE